jgi:hypothetical protein
MRRRVVAVSASLALGVAAFAPAAQAVYVKPKTEPPTCRTLIGNVVYGDPACEDTEFMP